jgi:predicted Zn-ribbon and HTH transcriptional regulator
MSEINITITTKGYQCERCGHKWAPRAKDPNKIKTPVVCPSCNSPYWNTPKIKPKKIKKNGK